VSDTDLCQPETAKSEHQSVHTDSGGTAAVAVSTAYRRVSSGRAPAGRAHQPECLTPLLSATVTTVLFTCAGQRVDIVRAFQAAGARVLGADADPLAPALYHADLQAIVPLVADPGYVPALAALVREQDVRLIVPLNDLDHPVLSRARDELAPALLP